LPTFSALPPPVPSLDSAQPSSTTPSVPIDSRPASTLTILPAQPEDYIRISDLKTAAFKGSLIDTALFPSLSAEARRPHGVANFAYALRNPQTRLIKAVNQDGEIVGEAQYSVPLREGEEAFEPPKEERPAWPEGADLAEIEALFSKAGFKEVKGPKICAPFLLRSSFHPLMLYPLSRRSRQLCDRSSSWAYWCGESYAEVHHGRSGQGRTRHLPRKFTWCVTSFSFSSPNSISDPCPAQPPSISTPSSALNLLVSRSTSELEVT
jgi:hypothetical protein